MMEPAHCKKTIKIALHNLYFGFIPWPNYFCLKIAYLALHMRKKAPVY